MEADYSASNIVITEPEKVLEAAENSIRHPLPMPAYDDDRFRISGAMFDEGNCRLAVNIEDTDDGSNIEYIVNGCPQGYIGGGFGWKNASRHLYDLGICGAILYGGDVYYVEMELPVLETVTNTDLIGFHTTLTVPQSMPEDELVMMIQSIKYFRGSWRYNLPFE
jgi:hypothetical protein